MFNCEIISLSNYFWGNMCVLIDIGILYDDDIDKVIFVLEKVCECVVVINENIVEGLNVIGV